MSVSMATAAGLAAGLVGAAAWAAIAWFTHFQIGWLAWGIGALVGFATLLGGSYGADAQTTGGRRDTSPGLTLGIIAALITALSLCGGKYATVEASLMQAQEELSADTESTIAALDEPTLIAYRADQIGRDTHGPEWPAQYDWPEGVDPSTAASEAEYPRKLWSEAERTWGKMSDEERDAFRETVAERMRGNLADYLAANLNDARKEGFLGSFGPVDLLFFGLGIVTAFKVAGSGDEA